MRMEFAVFFLVLALVTSGSTQTKTKEIDIPYERFVLDNGLTVIVHEDHKAPIVAINTWYHVGSKNEKPGKTGFAHLFEHLMFGGSEHAPGRYIDGMERIGATDLNGTTNPDRTNYFQNVPTSAVDFTLWAVDGVRSHGAPAGRAGPEDARFAAGRGAERETPGREPAVRGDTATAHAEYV